MFACVQVQDSPPIERLVSSRDKEAIINPLASKASSSPIVVSASASPSSTSNNPNSNLNNSNDEGLATASPPESLKKVFLPSLSEKLAGLSESEKNQIHFPVIVATKEQDTMFKYTVYQVKVTHRTYEWFVEHRYSEFQLLNKKLIANLKEKPSWWPKLPPKQLSKLDANLIQYRQQMLNWYLQTIALHPSTRLDIDLIDFLSPPTPSAPNRLKLEYIKYELDKEISHEHKDKEKAKATEEDNHNQESLSDSPTSVQDNVAVSKVPTPDDDSLHDSLHPLRVKSTEEKENEAKVGSPELKLELNKTTSRLDQIMSLISPRGERRDKTVLFSPSTSPSKLQSPGVTHLTAVKLLTVDLMPAIPPLPHPEGNSVRDKVAYEIYTSEFRFVRSVDLILQIFLKPLRLPHDGESILLDQEIDELFGNIEKIAEFNKKLLLEIEERIKNWNNEQLIGDIFLRLGPFFKVYSEYYNNYDAAMELFADLMQSRKRNFSTFLELCASRKECAGLDLPALLIQPVQRVPRVVLLLDSLLSKTPKEHPDYLNIEAAGQKIKDITGALNANIKKEESECCPSSTFKEYQNILHLINSTRTMIWEGAIQFHAVPILGPQSLKIDEKIWMTIKARAPNKKRGGANCGVAYAFNDMIYVATQNEKYEIAYPHAWIEEPAENGKVYFTLRTPERVFVLITQTPEECTLLFSAISEAMKGTEECSSEERVLKYTFSGIGDYEGDMERGKLDSRGKLTFTNSPYLVSYDGYWEKNMFSGFGTLTFMSGALYTGEFKAGKPDGDGSLKTPNGAKYIGAWKQAMKHGRGQIIYTRLDSNTQEIFSGEFFDDYITGYGKLMCEDIEYEGAWDVNLQHGKGKFSCGRYAYDGDWFYGQKHGMGSFQSIGVTYQGAWRNDKFHGKGTLTTREGKYEGDFSFGLRHGKGTMTYASGAVYEGAWTYGKRNGEGKYSDNGNVYEGTWVNDLRQGNGTQVYSDGSKYIGVWYENKRNGWGVWTGSDNSKYEGEWWADKKEGRGTLTLNEGRYVGHFCNDLMHGHGIWTSFLDKTSFEGEWVSGKKHGKGTLSGGGVFRSAMQQVWAQDSLQTPGNFDTIPSLPLPTDLVCFRNS